MTKEQKTQIIGKMLESRKSYVCFNTEGIFKFKVNQGTSMRKILNLNKKTSLKIVQTQFLTNGKHRFLISVIQECQKIEAWIDGKEELQMLLKLLGSSVNIRDLQDILVSFKKIGQGAFAQVYLATTKYQTKFAVKAFQKKTLQDTPKLKKAFENQIFILKALNSPHIMSFDYLFETQKAFYLKMEHFEDSLKNILSKKILISNQKKIMRQLLLALVEMKSKGIIHRDIKPDNIMMRKKVAGQSQCVLIDFGLATFEQDQPYLYLRCGTPGFIAPQIANLIDKEERQSCAADMFSLGCIFFLILTGHHLFSATTAEDILRKNRIYEYSRKYLNKLSLNQKDLLLKMIQINPLLRITPQAALNHKYFQQQVDDFDQIPDQQSTITKQYKRLSMLSNHNQKQILTKSALSNSINSIKSQVHRAIKKSVNDSCLTFELGPNVANIEEKNSSNKYKRASFDCSQLSYMKHSRFYKNNHFDVQIL